LPFGLLAAAGLMIFLPGGGGQGRLRFDWLGFSVLAIGIGGLQLMLDRGQDQDWFTSREIIAEAVFAGLGFYLFLVHVSSARHPLIPREFPRLCRGGSKSLTFQGVVSGHPSMKLRFVSRQSTRTMEFHQWTSSRA
jgi:hypothetical protein